MRKIQNIPLKLINKKNKRFLFGFPFSSEKLTESIREFGLTSPIIVKKEKGRLVLVSGQKRFNAVLNLKFKTIMAIIWDDSKNDKEIFELVVKENALRGLNVVEKSNIIHLLMKYFKCAPEAIIEKYFQYFGYNKNPILIRKLEKITKLNDSLKSQLLRLSEDHALLIFGIDEDAYLKKMLRFVLDCRLNFNLTREFIDHIRDISIVSGLPQLDILSSFNKIIEDKDVVPDQKVKMVRQKLYEQRYPNIHLAKKRLEAGFANLKLNKDIKLKIPENMGEGQYSLELKFNDSKSLDKLVENINEHKDNISKIF